MDRSIYFFRIGGKKIPSHKRAFIRDNSDRIQIFDQAIWNINASYCSFTSHREKAIFKTGGFVQAGGKANYVEVYLPHNDTWRQVTCVNENHFGHKSCSVAGRIYVFGGF